MYDHPDNTPTSSEEPTTSRIDLTQIYRWPLKTMRRIVFSGLFVLLFLLTCIWVGVSLHHVKKHELSFTFHRIGGEIEQVSDSGWIFRNRFTYALHKVDLRPFQVSIEANKRILNAMLVRFDPKGLNEFIRNHGQDAADDEVTFKEILKSYAFDENGGTTCLFLIVEKSLSPTNNSTTPQ